MVICWIWVQDIIRLTGWLDLERRIQLFFLCFSIFFYWTNLLHFKVIPTFIPSFFFLGSIFLHRLSPFLLCFLFLFLLFYGIWCGSNPASVIFLVFKLVFLGGRVHSIRWIIFWSSLALLPLCTHSPRGKWNNIVLFLASIPKYFFLEIYIY